MKRRYTRVQIVNPARRIPYIINTDPHREQCIMGLPWCRRGLAGKLIQEGIDFVCQRYA